MRKLKVLLGIESTIGGAFTHVRLLAEGLPKDQFEVTVVASGLRGLDFKPAAAALRAAGVEVIHIPMQRALRPFQDYRAFSQILTLLRASEFDIVHSHSSKAGALFRLAARRAAVPSILHTPHTFHFQGKSGLARSFFLMLERRLGKLSHGMVFVSQEEKNLALAKGICGPEAAHFIPNGIDPELYQAAEPPRQGPEVVIGGVGRLAKQKNWARFLDVAALVAARFDQVEFRLFVPGAEAEMADLVRKRGLEGAVECLPYQADLAEAYRKMDIFFNSSDWEGLPYTIMEAMASGLPVVASDVAGNRELVLPENTGFLFDSVSEGAENMARLVENVELRRSMGKNGLERIRSNYLLSDFIFQHVELYRVFTKT